MKNRNCKKCGLEDILQIRHIEGKAKQVLECKCGHTEIFNPKEELNGDESKEDVVKLLEQDIKSGVDFMVLIDKYENLLSHGDIVNQYYDAIERN